jgi:hypothetical protein
MLEYYYEPGIDRNISYKKNVLENVSFYKTCLRSIPPLRHFILIVQVYVIIYPQTFLLKYILKIDTEIS